LRLDKRLTARDSDILEQTVVEREQRLALAAPFAAAPKRGAQIE
jgi:hypothetical protein